MMRSGSPVTARRILFISFRAADVNQTALGIPSANDEDFLAAGRLLRFSPWAEEIVI